MTRRKIMLRRLNDALPGLVMGILIYGLAVELIGVWFVADKLRFTSGLAIGIALAEGMAINIAVVLQDAVDVYGESNARQDDHCKVPVALRSGRDRIFCHDEI